MTNTKAVDLKNIRQGDRVLVSGCGDTLDDAHWGTTIEPSITGDGWYVDMDDATLELARAYFGAGEGGAYYALDSEIIRHIPANKVAMHEGRPVNVEDHGQPKTLTVHDDIQATLDYLHATTRRMWKATTKDVCLEVDGTTTYAGTITISFTEDK